MDSVIYLEPVLRAKKVQLTPQEETLLREWKGRARRSFEFGGLAGGGVAYLVTKRLPRNVRIAVCGGAAAFSGIALLLKSIESTAEHFLSLQGTRVQGELAQIMLKNHRNDPWVQKRISKYFYPEIVYNDSSVDQAVYRWRYRNAFGDLTGAQSRQETDSEEKEVKTTPTPTPTTSKETKQVHASGGGETLVKDNAFDLVFGNQESELRDVPQPDGPRVLSRRQTRKEKRMRRRHRHARHEEESEVQI